MERVGLQNVYYLPNGFAIGTLPANDPSLTRKIGFISHMDTADFNAENISPQVIENYDGGTIALGDSGYSLDPADFANLHINVSSCPGNFSCFPNLKFIIIQIILSFYNLHKSSYCSITCLA